MTNATNKTPATKKSIDTAELIASTATTPRIQQSIDPREITKPTKESKASAKDTDIVRKAITLADGALAGVEAAQLAFADTLATFAAHGVTPATLSGAAGQVAAGKHYATAKDCIARRVFSVKEYNLYTNSVLAKKVDGKDTARGAMHKLVNGRMRNLRNALAKSIDAESKPAGKAKTTAIEAWTKKVLDQTAKFKALSGDQTTTAAKATKAAWVDVNALHALTVKYMDDVKAITAK